MRHRESQETERDPAVIPAQGQPSGHDPFLVEPDRFLEELMKAVEEEEVSKETSGSHEPGTAVPSRMPPRPERVRYNFD